MMSFKKLIAATFAVSSQAIAADLSADDIVGSLARPHQINVETQFFVNDQPYSVTSFAFEKQEHTDLAHEPSGPIDFDTKKFLANSGHLRFNTTVDKAPIKAALSAGFRRVPESSYSADLELFVRSQSPECGAALLLAAKKMDPSQLTRSLETEEEDVLGNNISEAIKKLAPHGLLEFDASKEEYCYLTNKEVGIRITYLYSNERKAEIKRLLGTDASAAKQ